MLAREDLDILVVATSEHRHADITVDGARAGVKAVFCEKPLATSMEDADRMIEACEENGVVLISGHTRRWRRIYHTVRDAMCFFAESEPAQVFANVEEGSRTGTGTKEEAGSTQRTPV